MADALVKSDVIAATLGISPSTLAKSRVRGDGPPFIKIGHAVRYDQAEVKAWIESRRRRATCKEG